MPLWQQRKQHCLSCRPDASTSHSGGRCAATTRAGPDARTQRLFVDLNRTAHDVAEIASQSNLLALNVAIEAARWVSEAGRGSAWSQTRYAHSRIYPARLAHVSVKSGNDRQCDNRRTGAGQQLCDRGQESARTGRADDRRGTRRFPSGCGRVLRIGHDPALGKPGRREGSRGCASRLTVS